MDNTDILIYQLKQLRPKKRRIVTLWLTIEDINAKLEHCTSNNTGLPRSTAERNVTEALLDKKAKAYEEIQALALECREGEEIIERCDDVLVKTWMEYHFDKGFSWDQSARKSGSGITGNGARMSVERYLRRLK